MSHTEEMEEPKLPDQDFVEPDEIDSIPDEPEGDHEEDTEDDSSDDEETEE